MVIRDRVSNKIIKEEIEVTLLLRGIDVLHMLKQHVGNCLAGIDGCFGCINKGNTMRDFPNLKAIEKGTK